MIGKKFNVTVLSSTPETDMIEVFRLSRPSLLHTHDGIVSDNLGNSWTYDEYLGKLIDFDLSLSYFPVYTLSIESSILIRDFFYTFNTPARWAFTHRNGMPEKLYASEEVYSELDKPLYEEFERKIQQWRRDEIDFDTARGYMPLSLSTQWSISLSIKALMRILGFLHYIVGDNQLFHTIWLEFYNKIPNFGKWSKLIKKYEYDSFLSSYDSAKVKEEIGFNLYAQLIRHEDIYVTGIDDFINNFLVNRGTCSSHIKVKVHCSNIRWMEILKVRTAWFSMTDNWGDPNSWSIFLDHFLTGNLEDDKAYIKYFDDKGRFDDSSIKAYSIDDNLRVRKGKNPYYPDAFALEDPSILEERIRDRGLNPLFKDYRQIFTKGYVRNNPDNELRRKWYALRANSN